MRSWIRPGTVVLIIVLYLLLGAILPFARQPKPAEKSAAFHPQSVYGTEGTGQRVDLITDNEEALAERIRLISQAQDRIILSTFDFRADSAGVQVLAALTDAAERGVRVQVLVDGVSGFLRLEREPRFYALSAQETAEIKIYNPVRPWLPWKLMGRLHDKYLIVDETAYVLGGRNTYNFFLGAPEDWVNYDWDALVWCGGNTQSLDQLTDYFGSVWNYKESKLFHNDPKLLEKKKVQKARRELAELYEEMREDHPDWFTDRDYNATTLPASKLTLLSNPVHIYAKEPVCFYEMTELMADAGGEVSLHTPYIICNRWMLDRLAMISGSADRASLLTNSVANNGNPFGAMEYWTHKKSILETGVQVLEYDSGVSYHGKCAVAGDRLTLIGSCNYDMRSAYIDTELMLAIDSPEVAGAMREEMARYEDECLIVKDKDTSVAPEGRIPREIPPQKYVLMALMRVLIGWSRFLL